MLRPGLSLALSPTGTFVDALLRPDFAMRRHPSYAGAWPFPRPDFHRLEDACLWARRRKKQTRRPDKARARPVLVFAVRRLAHTRCDL